MRSYVISKYETIVTSVTLLASSPEEAEDLAEVKFRNDDALDTDIVDVWYEVDSAI